MEDYMYSEIKNNGVLHWSELAAKFDLASHQVKEFLVGFLNNNNQNISLIYATKSARNTKIPSELTNLFQQDTLEKQVFKQIYKVYSLTESASENELEGVIVVAIFDNQKYSLTDINGGSNEMHVKIESIIDSALQNSKSLDDVSKIKNRAHNPVLNFETKNYKYTKDQYLIRKYGYIQENLKKMKNSTSKTKVEAKPLKNSMPSSSTKILKKEIAIKDSKSKPVEVKKENSKSTSKTTETKNNGAATSPKKEAKTTQPKASEMFNKKAKQATTTKPSKNKKEISEEEKKKEKQELKPNVFSSSDDEPNEKPKSKQKTPPPKSKSKSYSRAKIESSSSSEEQLNSDSENTTKTLSDMKISSKESQRKRSKKQIISDSEEEAEKEPSSPDANKENKKFITQKVYETKTFEDEEGFIVTKQVAVMKQVEVKVGGKSKAKPKEIELKSSQENSQEDYENVKINNKPKEKPKIKPKKKAMGSQKSIASFFVKRDK